MVKNHALTVNIFITYEEISYSCEDSSTQKYSYIPTYKGNSLRKSLHNHRCYFGFTFEVRFCHVISFICIAISEIGNRILKSANQTLWCVGFRNLSAFLLVVSTQIARITSPRCKIFKKLSQRILWGTVFSSVPVHRDLDSQFQTFRLPLHVRPTFLIGNWFANLGAMMCGKVNTIVVKLVDSTARDIRPSWNTKRFDISVIQLGNT